MLHPAKSVETVRLRRHRDGDSRSVRDAVTVEEPMEIRLRFPDPATGAPRAESIAVTMRTPGQDFELAAGFLLTEGVVCSPDQVQAVTYCTGGREAREYNIVEVRLRSGDGVDLARLSRNVFTSSSCGVCGKASLEAVEVQGCVPLPAGTLVVEESVLVTLPDRLRESQEDFGRTGGIHAAGLFDPGGGLVRIAEDVGRHNAVDKVLGASFLAGELPLLDRALVVSGRVSFEVVQKALMAGVPMVVAVGAPSSLAVDLARRFDMTLAGFVRDGGYNLYHGERRVG